MPGSIRVSVLEAFDLPETLADNEDVVIKVAIGTREYQTVPSKAVGGKTTAWNLDFDFPVLNLRDNLSVTLIDSKGEPVSKNEIDTPSIVEKGSFDVNLLLNGGGTVHVCLSFVLTDEERRRIDVMRAAALQRREQQALKLAAASTQSTSLQEESDVGSSELQSSQGKSLEKHMDKDEVPKDISATGSQKVDASQIKPILAATEEDVSLFVEQEPSGIVDSTVADIAIPNQDLTDSFTTEERSLEDQKVVYHEKSDISPTGQAKNEDLADSWPDANLKRTSSGVKAKIKAFEKTRPQDNDLGFKPTETEQPRHEEKKALSIQGRKRIDLVGLSKQFLSGAVSGAVVIAACALLWAAKAKRRNSSTLQRSKQRKRK